jgi:hypothetical protein
MKKVPPYRPQLATLVDTPPTSNDVLVELN